LCICSDFCSTLAGHRGLPAACGREGLLAPDACSIATRGCKQPFLTCDLGSLVDESILGSMVNHKKLLV
ncbi:MAG: hypothetical protein L0229_28845, partial [Blastocatellia bacterium]|nr:hypothetical protein [Blastocatellia bacterium]